MGDCSYCGDADVLTRTCNRCGTETCSEHLLPENHDCAGLTHSQTNSRYLQSEVDAKLGNDTAASHDTSNHTQTSTPANTNTAEVEPNYDSSPDVAPDGSLAEQEKLTTDQPTSETNASRSLSTYLQTIRQRLSNRNYPPTDNAATNRDHVIQIRVARRYNHNSGGVRDRQRLA